MAVSTPKTLTRRVVLGMIAVAATGGTMMTRSAFAQATGSSASKLLLDTDVCAIIPEVTEGPYYFDPALVRADITEGKPGLATELRLQVVDQLCQPIAGARVDVWHCDATGLYSGYVNQSDSGSVDEKGETFLRGTQFADDTGVVSFDSIYPGWYSGRTTHIHFKVFLDEVNVLTGQIFFPDELTDAVYRDIAPYNERTRERDMRNDSDGIAQQSGSASVATVEQLADKYVITLIVGVDPTAESTGGFGGPGDAQARPGTPPQMPNIG